jgi:hypothetical protein
LALLGKKIGSIKGIEDLRFSRLSSAKQRSITLQVVISPDDAFFPRYPSGLIALANALREHTTLREFGWIDHCFRMEAAQITAVDPVLWACALPACPHLRKVVIMTNCAQFAFSTGNGALFGVADDTTGSLQCPKADSCYVPRCKIPGF